MTSKYWIGAAVLLALAGGAAYRYSHGGAAATETEAAEGAGGSVLVQTARTSRQPMPLTMSVFGDIAAGQVESHSFPQAGQLVRLAVVPGQAVRRGDLLATLSSDPNALAAYQQAAGALAFAQRERQRVQDLLALQLATQSQLDSAAKAEQDAQAALAAQARLGGAHGTLDLRSQYDGVVAAIPAAQGDRVAAGATIVQVGRTDTLRVLLSVEPGRVAELRPGQGLTLEPQQDGAPAIHASLVSVQDMVDAKTQMAGAIAQLPAGARLPVGLHVQGVIELGSRTAWSVPRQSVLVDEQGAYLFQVAHDKARRVAVRQLVEAGATLGVEGPLDAALPVVVLGNYELQDGASVRRSAP